MGVRYGGGSGKSRQIGQIRVGANTVTPMARKRIVHMTSLHNALKSEIARIARKEHEDELLALRKVTAAHRAEIAALKRNL
jgi:hypothetical protein